MCDSQGPTIVETDNLLLRLEADTPIIAKIRLKTLKKGVEDMYDISGQVGMWTSMHLH
jgi:hypothetical protein